MSKLDASTSLPNSANNKRQADARFKRAEFDLKQKCLLNGVEYEGPSPTESTNETKVRRALIRRKIDRINEDVHQPAVPKRQRNRRFQRHENYIKRACEIEGDNVEYVPPSPLESPAQTKSRRGKLQGQISRLEKARGSQKEYRDTWIYDLLKRTDKSREDVTPLLLEKFDIHNVKRSDVCCAFDLTRTDRKIRQIRSQYVRNNGQYYSAAVEECYLQHSARFRESLRSIQRLYRKELDYEDSGEMKRTLNNECSGWFCTEIGQHGTHFVSGYLDREQSEKHCVAKKILDQINISGADLRSIVNASKAVGNMKRTVNVFEIKEEVFVDPSSRKRQQNYWIDIEDIACIEHGQIDICEKEDDGGMPRVDVTPLLLKEFGMETVTKDIPLLRARTEWREVYSVCLETKRIIQIAEQAARDEQSLLESLILLLKQAKEEGQHAEGSLVQAFQDEKRRADRKIKKLGDQITSLENVNGFSGMTYTNTKERVVKGVVGQMNVTMDKLRSIRNMCEIAESKASDEHTSRESLMLLLEQAKEGQQAEGFLAQALQDEKHSAEKSSQELSFKLRDLEKELTERSVDKGVVEKINITGEKLRGIANEFTGAVEGLKMKRTLNIAGPYSHENRVDLHSQKFRQKCYVDIEDITDIKDGVVGLDWREEKKSVSITAEGGSRTFGCQRIHEAKYWGDPDENLHRFHVSLEQTSRRCKPNELLSCEVRTNKESRFLSRLDQSRWLKYRIYRDGDGLLYKEVEHTWFNCFWYDELSLYVKIGPLPDDLECAETEFIDIDPERVQTAFQDAYAPLFSESTNTMNIVFPALVFEENIMKKGGLLHHIALTKLSVTSPTLTTSMSDSDSESNLDSSSDEEENRTQKCAAEEENRTQKCAHCQEVFDAYYVAIQHEIQCAHEANYKKVTGNETLSNNAAIDDSDHSKRGYADFLDLFRESDVGEFDPIFAEDDHEERDEFHIDCEVLDDEATIESEENLGRDISYKDEIDLLNRENRVSIEEILALYASRSPVDYCSEEQHLNATRIQAVWRSFQIRNTKKPK